MDLLLAPFLPRVVLVEARQIAVVALVQRLVADSLQVALAELVEDDAAGLLGALEGGGEGDVESQAARLEFRAGGLCLGDALLGQVDVAPAGEQVLQIPFALAVAHEHEGA